MPTVGPGSKILVTGANGYIGVWVVRTLLEQGYAVRGAVRSMSKGAFLLDEFKSYGDRFELVTVDDFLKEGAFDEAVKGIDAIQHLAAPVTLDFKDPKDVIDPAVNGTLGILRSAQRTSTVKRVIMLGSIVAVNKDVDRPLDENDWNDACVEEYEKKGVDTPNYVVYEVEKVLSERAAWSFYNANKNQLSWDLSVITPPYVFGPYIGAALTPSDLNSTSKTFYNSVVGFNSTGQPNEALISSPHSWVDVRDLSFAATRLLSIEAAAGERIIVRAGGCTMQDWVDVANSLSPSPIPSHAPGTAKALPIGNPGAGRAVQKRLVDTSKEKRILGLKYRTMEECVRDTLADYERRGW